MGRRIPRPSTALEYLVGLIPNTVQGKHGPVPQGRDSLVALEVEVEVEVLVTSFGIVRENCRDGTLHG